MCVRLRAPHGTVFTPETACVWSQVIRIREKELAFFKDNFNAISTTASLLAGFAFAGFLTNDVESDADNPNQPTPAVRYLYFGSVTLAFGNNP